MGGSAKIADALFISKQYDSLINYCSPFSKRPGFASKANDYIFAATYFSGNELKSKDMLAAKIKGFSSYLSALDLLSESNIAMINYFQIDSNRIPIVRYVINEYNKERYVAKQHGISIINFFINDLWMRRNSFNQFAFTNMTETLFKQQDSLQNDNLYKFYKEHNRLFKPSEVGESVYLQQFILLCHANNLEKRSFYHSLIQKAVAEGYCDVKHEVSFILRTESITNKDFFTTLPKRIEELKKIYNLKEYSYIPY